MNTAKICGAGVDGKFFVFNFHFLEGDFSTKK